MASAASQSIISASSCAFPSHVVFKNNKPPPHQRVKLGSSSNARLFLFTVHASTSSSSEDSADCNDEECAPDKEVGKVSMEWLAGEKTKVVGTFPPKKKGWTGYVEKDTAGQTNIYSVEPAVYVAESVISSGTAGTSSEGAENTAAITAGLALIAIASASSILIQVSKNPPGLQKIDYSGPPLGYYISKFKPASIVEASILPEPQSSPTVEASVPTESQSSEPQVSSSFEPENGTPAVPEVQAEIKETIANVS